MNDKLSSDAEVEKAFENAALHKQIMRGHHKPESYKTSHHSRSRFKKSEKPTNRAPKGFVPNSVTPGKIFKDMIRKAMGFDK